MQASDIPTKFNVPFGSSAGGSFIRDIPEASQISIQDGAASLTTGFPPLNFLPVSAGGVPPFGQDMNGILFETTAWSRWFSAGGPLPFDSAFSAAVGGYPAGALVASAAVFGYYWLCTADDNTSDPDAGGAGWDPVSFLGGTDSTGDVKWRPTDEDIAGWIKAYGTTIGNAASGADLASAVTFRLFKWHWERFSNTQCPVTPSGRGANATVDYAANKKIQILSMIGLGQFGADALGSSFLVSVPVTSGSRSTPGSVLGENLHALVLAENAPHAHALTDPGHVHGASDPGHIHGISDSGHVHPILDSGHVHQVPGTSNPASPDGTTSARAAGNTNNTVTTNAIETGVQVVSNTTGILIASNITGVSIASNITGISMSSSGSGTPHNTVPRVMVGTWYLKL